MEGQVTLIVGHLASAVTKKRHAHDPRGGGREWMGRGAGKGERGGQGLVVITLWGGVLGSE